MEANDRAKLNTFARIIHCQREEIARLKEENARLMGIVTAAQKAIDQADEEVFRLVHGRAEASDDCVHVIVRV